MADSSAPYRKLPGRGSGIIGASTLWEGDSHLLIVKSWPSGESYRRFFFSDIQAIILRRTKQRMVINLVLGILLLVLGAPLATAMIQGRDPSDWLVTFGIVTAVFVIFILINSLLGPACTLTIQTAIQYERLPAVRRVPRARQLLARVLPRIAAAQAEPAPATL